jgi:ATP-dependent Clp protease protease subunit
MKPSKTDLPIRPRGLSFDLKPVAAPHYRVDARQSDVVIEIFGVIGLDVTDAQIAAALRQAGERPVSLLINSPGGDYFQGLSIFNLLVNYSAPVTVRVMAIAASAASIIAMAGTRVEMMRGAEMMIHNAWAVAAGDNRVMTEAAEFLLRIDAAIAAIYASRTEQSPEMIRRMMDSETFLTAQQAVELGFADILADGDALEKLEPIGAGGKQPSTLREFEAAVRQLGFPKTAAARLASGGWAALDKSENVDLNPVAAKLAAMLSAQKQEKYHVR